MYNALLPPRSLLSPHSSPIHPRIAFTLRRPQTVDAGHGCGIRQPTAKHDRVSARVDMSARVALHVHGEWVTDATQTTYK